MYIARATGEELNGAPALFKLDYSGMFGSTPEENTKEIRPMIYMYFKDLAKF